MFVGGKRSNNIHNWYSLFTRYIYIQHLIAIGTMTQQVKVCQIITVGFRSSLTLQSK